MSTKCTACSNCEEFVQSDPPAQNKCKTCGHSSQQHTG